METLSENLNERLNISYYKTIADIRPERGIFIVQHIESKKIFVKKQLKVYDITVYKQLQQMDIAGIPKIYELYEQEGLLTVIEEYITGKTLDEFINNGSSLSVDKITDIALQLCNILFCLHSMTPPVIHRDIKPSNIIMTRSGMIVLLDMNAAKYVDSEKERDTRLLGTKGYAAPEQYGFGTSDERTDIYAIGILLKTLLANSSENVTEKLNKIIAKCIEINPNDRYNSIVELRQDLISIYPQSEKHTKTYTDYLPPGFRHNKPLNILVASVTYLLVFWLSLTLKIENVPFLSLMLQRIFCLIIFIAVIFFSCNYLNIHEKLILCRSQNKLIKIAGIILFDVIIVFVLFMLLMIITDILGLPI